MENFGINSILGTNFKCENSEGLSVYSLASTARKEETDTDIDFIFQLKALEEKNY